MTVADTSIIVTLMRVGEDHHEEAVDWYSGHRGPLVTTPLVLTEIDYMLRRFGPQRVVRGFYDQLERGGVAITWWPQAPATTLEVSRRRPDIGLIDASLVALAGHLGTTRIATFDQRHFRTLKPLTGEDSFTLLPADAD